MLERFSDTEPPKSNRPNTLFAGNDKKVCTIPGGTGLGSQGTLERAANLALLDIYTPKGCKAPKYNVDAPSLIRAKPHKFDCQRRSENCRWNRATLGMMMPGVSWFLTLTTSPESKRAVRHNYDNFWRYWWRKNYPLVENLWVETNEGLGVVHAILRFPVEEYSGSKHKGNLEASPLVPSQGLVQNEWQVRHQAFSTWSQERSKGKLANYIRQRDKEKLAGEIKKQDRVVAWNYSRGWLPSGFLKVWGRAWTDTIRLIPQREQQRVIADWLAACLANPENLDLPPIYEDNLILENYVC